jgi:succinyl-diaminopimelate desuccinylase
MTPAQKLTQELIRLPSISPQDLGCQDVLAKRLAQLGFDIEWMPFNDVQNFWATKGTDGPTLCFAGHTDVVPTGPVEGWNSDPFEPTVRDGILYGRGAADMKSGLAAMVVAAERFVATTPAFEGRLAFLITSDEEGRSVDGTKRVVEVLKQRHEKIDWCVVGEPASSDVLGDTIKIGRRGSLSARLTIEGVQGHIAYPQLADNPIHRLAPLLHDLTTHRFDEGNAHFDPSSLQVANMAAGTGAPNVIPGEAWIRFNIRFAPVQTIESLQKTIQAIIDRHQVKHKIEWFISGLPFYTPPGRFTDAISAAIESVCGRVPVLSTSGGTSDGRFIATLGTEIAEVGVPNGTIHKLNECVRLEDIDQLETIYVTIMQRLLPSRP